MKKLVFILLAVLCTSSVFAQDVYTSSGKSNNSRYKQQKEGGFDPSRMVFGGSFIFGISNGVTNLGVNPIIGYRATDRFIFGVGLGYEYLQVNNAAVLYDTSGGVLTTKPYHLKTSIFSASLWGRYLIFNNLFLHAEPEMNSLETFTQNDHFSISKRRIFVPTLLLGGGLRQPIGERASFLMSVLYDVLQDPNSPYLNRVDIRIGVVAGF